jgi:hypothetical protein
MALRQHYVALFGIPVEGVSNAPAKLGFRPGTNIPDWRIDVTTLRTTLPDTEGEVRKYLRTSNESMNFVFDRDPAETGKVVGLDIDAAGNDITWNKLQYLLMQDALDLQARQQAVRDAAAPPEDALGF